MLDFGFYNMDCMQGMKNMPDKCVDLTLTDIPYDGVNLARQNTIREFRKGTADIITFDLKTFLDEVRRVTKGTIIVFCGTGQVSDIYKHFLSDDNLTVRQLIWEKVNPSPVNGQFVYLSGIENAVWAKFLGGGTFNAHCKNTVFRYPTGSSEIHPTEKNHRLLAELINDNSDVGQTVFDPCAGSGSTLIVANDLGRNYIGFELDKGFYDVAKKRLDNETAQLNIWTMGYNPYQE